VEKVWMTAIAKMVAARISGRVAAGRPMVEARSGIEP
jgi:hypothetical protein